jgi:anti-anti-sigma regulatory factor
MATMQRGPRTGARGDQTRRSTTSSWCETGQRFGSCSEFDLAARPALEELLLGLDPARRERVVVDIREVTFFDTTGLNIAQRFDGWGREHAIPVRFTRSVPAVANALRVSGLASTLTFSDAPEDHSSSSD